MRANTPPSTQVATCSQILIAPSNVSQKPSSSAWSQTKAEFLRKSRAELEYQICCGLGKMGTLIFSLLSCLAIPSMTTCSFAEAISRSRQC